ncbi:sugar ABC transporter substrate-binding protein [Paeniglutamicibacter sp. ABSL32-1]|uniref:sugar ABC transporter substrate-binding protein n=1 Tax=Paeniglutamicibacter quisquiliarum TaxID=2849498 RepID=UPI001C2D73D0|nr:sugar ABC transporter substrate-binding protein [Paeniglutamicibacter quisquiliarum]MBV1780082.1 sugar ABC transporter substrate-binding protein [Paeniglutamicibacter quisquiliarum]
MKSRKFARLVSLGAVASLVLAGCTSGTASEGDSSGEPDKGAVAMSFAGLDIQIWVDELEYMKPIVEAAGYELVSDDPQWNIQSQVSSWQSWIQRGDIKAIMGYPVQSDSMVPVTTEANAANIPVVGYATEWEGIEAALVIDNYNDGLTLGEEAGKWIVEKYGDAEVPVGFFSYYETDLGIERSNGIKDGLKKAGAKVKISDMPSLTIEDGLENTKNQLSANPNTKVWLSTGSDQLIGSYRALMSHGVDPKDPGYLLGALDATDESLDLIKEKDSIWRLGFILPAKELAEKNAQLLIEAAEGTLKGNIEISSTRVTPENADSFRSDRKSGS